MSLDSKPKNFAGDVCHPEYPSVSWSIVPINSQGKRDLCIEKQQRHINWFIRAPLTINTCIIQHLMGNAVWQQHRHYHLQLHCAKRWQLLQNPLLGKWGKSVLHRRAFELFFICMDTFESPSFLSTLPLVWLQSRTTFAFQMAYCDPVVLLMMNLIFMGINKAGPHKVCQCLCASLEHDLL